MVCPHCQGADDVFSGNLVRNELKDYRKKGPRKSTQVVLNLIKNFGVQDLTLLDIGGGIGAIQHELISAGVVSAIDVDASSAYINACKEEAEKQGHLDKITYRHGDFVQLAANIDASDIVTLDRVVCCYPDVRALVNLSSAQAKHYYALVFPRDNWLFKAAVPIVNFLAFRLRGNPFRTFIHSREMIDSIIRKNGLELVSHQKVGLWQVLLYKR